MTDEMKTLLRAIADEKQMQWFLNATWLDCDAKTAIYQLTANFVAVRIKPKPKPDFVYLTRIIWPCDGCIEFDGGYERPLNLKLTFDGDTRALKSAEVLE